MLNQIKAFRYIKRVHKALHSSAYKPNPMRRILIPKIKQPKKFHPLNIPTITNKIIQTTVKNILEPIFEADFYPSSFEFHPKKCAHEALKYIRRLLLPRVEKKTDSRLSYQ